MRVHLFIFLILFALVSIVSFRVSRAFFVSNAISQNNTFATAEVFGVATPSATIIPTTSPTPIPSPTPTPIEGLANHIVISEVQTATSGATLSDFIELYNPTSATISLNGFRLVMRTKTGSTDTNVVIFGSGDSISSHSYLLWCNTSIAIALGCDKNSDDTVSNNNSVALRNGPANTGTIVDAVAWGSGHTLPLVETSPFAINIPDNQSIERKAYSDSTQPSMEGGADSLKGNGFDLNNNSTDFILRTLSQPQNSSSAIETP